jgi:hypothetical protein
VLSSSYISGTFTRVSDAKSHTRRVVFAGKSYKTVGQRKQQVTSTVSPIGLLKSKVTAFGVLSEEDMFVYCGITFAFILNMMEELYQLASLIFPFLKVIVDKAERRVFIM